MKAENLLFDQQILKGLNSRGKIPGKMKENSVASNITLYQFNNLLTRPSPETGRLKELNYKTIISFAVTAIIFIITLARISAS